MLPYSLCPQSMDLLSIALTPTGMLEGSLDQSWRLWVFLGCSSPLCCKCASYTDDWFVHSEALCLVDKSPWLHHYSRSDCSPLSLDTGVMSSLWQSKRANTPNLISKITFTQCQVIKHCWTIPAILYNEFANETFALMVGFSTCSHIFLWFPIKSRPFFFPTNHISTWTNLAQHYHG